MRTQDLREIGFGLFGVACGVLISIAAVQATRNTYKNGVIDCQNGLIRCQLIQDANHRLAYELVIPQAQATR